MMKGIEKKNLLIGLVVGLTIGIVISIPLAQTYLIKPTYIFKPGIRCSWSPGMATCQQLLIERWDWTNLRYLNVTLRNVGPAPIFFLHVALGGKVMTAIYDELSGDYVKYFDLVESDGLQVTQTCSLGVATVSSGVPGIWTCSSNFTRGQYYPFTVYTSYGVFSLGIEAGAAYPLSQP